MVQIATDSSQQQRTKNMTDEDSKLVIISSIAAVNTDTKHFKIRAAFIHINPNHHFIELPHDKC